MNRRSAWLITILLSGCANPEGWFERPVYNPLPPRYVQGNPHLWKGCETERIACSSLDYQTGTCWIISFDPPSTLPQWVKTHEEKHCKGYVHA